MVIWVNDEQLWKLEFPIDFKEDGVSNVTCCKEVHPKKAQSPIDVKEEGIVIWFNDLQPLKQLLWIDFKEEGSSNKTCFKDEQLAN